MSWEDIIKMKRVGSGPQTTIHLTMEEMNKLMEDAKSDEKAVASSSR